MGITSGGETQVLTSFGPLKAKDLSTKKGLEKNAPFLELKEDHGQFGPIPHGQYQRCLEIR